GNQGMGLEFHRRCMICDENKQDKDILKFMKQIIKIRKENKELYLLDNNWIRANKDVYIIIYSKETIFIIMYNSDNEEKIY
ncbi:alpha-glycosidase, partial [Clostridium perfringens]